MRQDVVRESHERRPRLVRGAYTGETRAGLVRQLLQSPAVPWWARVWRWLVRQL
jgi:hypothetical protein